MDSIKCLHLLGERCQKQQIIQRNDPFDCCLTLLQSISTEDANILKHTREYHDFQNVVERLVSAHRQISQWNESDQMLVGCVEPSDFLMSFLQHTATDDIVNRVFDFLECRDLIHTMRTCSRFRELAERHATERTKNLASGRQLATAMQLLRAQEQIEGVAGMGISDRHVRVPALLLPRRILLTESGDTEYNGVYFCTGSNGNGYVFTKPRSPAQRLVASNQTSHRRLQDDSAVFDEAETEMTQPGQLLRCIIAKRFSGEVCLRPRDQAYVGRV